MIFNMITAGGGGSSESGIRNITSPTYASENELVFDLNAPVENFVMIAFCMLSGTCDDGYIISGYIDTPIDGTATFGYVYYSNGACESNYVACSYTDSQLILETYDGPIFDEYGDYYLLY